MFERFTDRSRKVMALANQEAIRHGHPIIDTEHILLGLIKEGTGVAVTILKPMVGGNLQNVRREVNKLMPPDAPHLPLGKLPQTREAKVAIMFAIEEAKSLHHNYVGTEHLLLGVIRQTEGIAGHALTNLGVKIDPVRNAIEQLLGRSASSAPSAGKNPPQPAIERNEPPPKRKPWWRFW